MIICGTGHRPDKLGGYSPKVTTALVELARDWFQSHRPYRVISGGALGWDQALAEAALSVKIPVTLALPFPGFEDRWWQHSKNFLYSQMQRADKVHYVCEAGYAGWKMQKRNEWMVDNSDLVLALWDGSSGGTGNCVQYARKVKKPITNLWELYHVLSTT